MPSPGTYALMREGNQAVPLGDYSGASEHRNVEVMGLPMAPRSRLTRRCRPHAGWLRQPEPGQVENRCTCQRPLDEVPEQRVLADHGHALVAGQPAQRIALSNGEARVGGDGPAPRQPDPVAAADPKRLGLTARPGRRGGQGSRRSVKGALAGPAVPGSRPRSRACQQCAMS
jgi:hypothetical protein